MQLLGGHGALHEEAATTPICTAHEPAEAEATHTEDSASNGSPGLDAASRLAEKAPGARARAGGELQAIVQRLWADARRDLERGHARQEGAREAGEGLAAASPPLPPVETPPPMASVEMALVATRQKLALVGGTRRMPGTTSPPPWPPSPPWPGLPGASGCLARWPHSASAMQRPRLEDVHSVRATRHRAENASRRLRQQQHASSAEQRETQLVAAERRERAVTEAARRRQLMASREETRRPQRGREMERRRAKGLHVLRGLVSREARRPHAALVTRYTLACDPHQMRVRHHVLTRDPTASAFLQVDSIRRAAACLLLQRYARRRLARHELQRLRCRRMQLAMCAQQTAWAARARLALPLEVQSEATRTSLLEMGAATLRRPFGVGAIWRGSV